MHELAKWDGFYVIVGSAAGALIGLQFVVMTLIGRKAGAASGRGRRRIRDADDRSFRRHFTLVGASTCAMAVDHPRRRCFAASSASVEQRT